MWWPATRQEREACRAILGRRNGLGTLLGPTFHNIHNLVLSLPCNPTLTPIFFPQDSARLLAVTTHCAV